MTRQLENDRLLRTLRSEPVDRSPIWLMRQAGRYLPEYRDLRQKEPDFMQFCRSAELTCEAALQPLRRYDLDATIVFSDILTIPEAMGMPLTFVPGTGPVFSAPLNSKQSIEALRPPSMDRDLNYVMQAVSALRKAVGNRLPVIGFSGSPWTLAAYMVEGQGSKNFAQLKALRHTDPNLLHQLLDVLARSIVDYLQAQVDAGADVLMLFDTWGGLLAYDDYAAFSLDYMQHIISQLSQSHNHVPVILFTKGGHPWLELIAKTGCHGIGVDWTVNLSTVRERIPDSIAVQGNLDPTTLLGSSKHIEIAVSDMLAAYGEKPGHIVNLGHGILPQTPPESVETLLQCVHKLSPSYHRSYD